MTSSDLKIQSVYKLTWKGRFKVFLTGLITLSFQGKVTDVTDVDVEDQLPAKKRKWVAPEERPFVGEIRYDYKDSLGKLECIATYLGYVSASSTRLPTAVYLTEEWLRLSPYPRPEINETRWMPTKRPTSQTQWDEVTCTGYSEDDQTVTSVAKINGPSGVEYIFTIVAWNKMPKLLPPVVSFDRGEIMSDGSGNITYVNPIGEVRRLLGDGVNTPYFVKVECIEYAELSQIVTAREIGSEKIHHVTITAWKELARV